MALLQREPAGDHVLPPAKRDQSVILLGFHIVWQRTGTDERGVDRAIGHVPVRVNPPFFRLAEFYIMCGDASKVRVAS